jgi:hypothetical protein
MTLIQELDVLIGKAGGFHHGRPWTSTYHGEPVRLSGVNESDASDRESFILIYLSDDGGSFDRHRYRKVTLYDPELDHMFGDFKAQMLDVIAKRATRQLGEDDDPALRN